MVKVIAEYIPNQSFETARKLGRLNPILVENNNKSREFQQKQESRNALLFNLGTSKLIDLLDKPKLFYLFIFLMNSQRFYHSKGAHFTINRSNLHERYLKYWEGNKKAKMGLTSFRDYLAELITEGLVTRYQTKYSQGDSTYSYLVDIATIKSNVSNYDKVIWELKMKYSLNTGSDKKRPTDKNLIKESSFIADNNNSILPVVDNFDQTFFELQHEEFNKRHEENRERYFARKKNTYPEKPRTSIPADFKLTEKTKEELLYTFPRMDEFYLDAGAEAIADHARHKNVQSDNWDWYIRVMIIKAYKADWNIVRWKAEKLRNMAKESNQDERIVADTQPRVVNCDLVQQLKEAIKEIEQHRSKSAALYLIKNVNLYDGKLNVELDEKTAREWAAHLPGVKKFITDIGYKSFAGIESVGFLS